MATTNTRKAQFAVIGLVIVAGICNLMKGDDPDPAAEPSKATAEVRPLLGATLEPADTEAPATEAPTDEPTAEPLLTEAPVIVQPTEAPAPIEPTAQPAPPTEAPAAAAPADPRPDLDPYGKVNCKDFGGNHAAAQAWWNFHRSPGIPNPGRLDGNDNDGDVCEE